MWKALLIMVLGVWGAGCEQVSPCTLSESSSARVAFEELFRPCEETCAVTGGWCAILWDASSPAVCCPEGAGQIDCLNVEDARGKSRSYQIVKDQPYASWCTPDDAPVKAFAKVEWTTDLIVELSGKTSPTQNPPVPSVGTVDSSDPLKTVDGKTGPRVYQAVLSNVTHTFVCWPYHGGAETDCRWYEPALSPSPLPTFFRTKAAGNVGYDFNFYDPLGTFKSVKSYNSLPWFDAGQAPIGTTSARIAGSPNVGFYLLKPPVAFVAGQALNLRTSCPEDSSGTVDSCLFL